VINKTQIARAQRLTSQDVIFPTVPITQLKMRDNEHIATVYVATDEKQLSISFPIGDSVEDLCLKVCV
jgi:hypothetical protein